MSATTTLGIEIKTGLIKHISEVENGLKCECICAEKGCEVRLIAVNNENNKRDHHFRHEVETDCKGGIETALHLLSKQIISESNYIHVSEKEVFNFSSSKEEVILDGYQPDVIVKDDNLGEEWLIEVAVTSFVKHDKLEKIKRDNFNCIEIDLREIDRAITPDDLKPILLDEINNRKVLNRIVNNNEVIEGETEKTITEWMVYGAIGIIAYFGLKRLFKKRR